MNELWWPLRVSAGEVVYPPGGIYGPRRQRDYQLVLLHTGSLNLTVDHETFHYEAGTTILLTPGRIEFFQFAPDSLSHHSWISVNGPELPPSWRLPTDARPPAVPLSTRMHSLAQEAIYYIHLQKAQHLLFAIGYHALQLFITEAMHAAYVATEWHEAVNMVEKYIKVHYKDAICLDDLCKWATVSKVHLCRLFRMQHGMSPMAYLWRYRTQRALELLRATGLSVADIAEYCGFKTPFHLHRRIKALTGLPPTQYRKQCWNSDSQPPALASF